MPRISPCSLQPPQIMAQRPPRSYHVILSAVRVADIYSKVNCILWCLERESRNNGIPGWHAFCQRHLPLQNIFNGASVKHHVLAGPAGEAFPVPIYRCSNSSHRPGVSAIADSSRNASLHGPETGWAGRWNPVRLHREAVKMLRLCRHSADNQCQEYW